MAMTYVDPKKATWKEWKLYYMDHFYKRYAEKWVNERDDRKLLSNMYYLLVEAVKSLDDEPNNMVCVAMNKYLDEEQQIMNDIIKHFERR